MDDLKQELQKQIQETMAATYPVPQDVFLRNQVCTMRGLLAIGDQLDAVVGLIGKEAASRLDRVATDAPEQKRAKQPKSS